MVKDLAIRDEFTKFLSQVKEIHEEHLTDVNLATLYRWKKQLSSDGHLRPKKASGRPIKTSERGERHLVRMTTLHSA
jgi:transposase